MKELKQIQRILAFGDKWFYVKDLEQDYHSQYGYIKKEDLAKKSGIVKTNTGKELTIFTPSFIDSYRKIKRGPQIISLKDLGLIITQTGINRTSKVLDAGAGSGAVACMLGNLVKQVVTYEIRDDFAEIVSQNIKYLGLKNVLLKKKNIYEGIDEKNLDLIILDLPEPWNVPDIEKALKIGGFIVSYSPTVPQAMDFVNKISKNENFVHFKTVELIERDWEIIERKVRPMSRMIGHTGFLSFVRRVK
ncbi:MAG: rRNA adenine N-6-methyltransferase family protein [Nanoarchaeota archaeon]|nr:rRNA adenine N-6-methyltransferase family protein [Nanoarchaeota archaeon]